MQVTKTFYQAVMLGVVTVLIGLILSMVFGGLKPELPAECEIWDKYYVMEVILFFTGVLIRYGLDTEYGKMYVYSQ
jgi:hypothetical protein